MALAHLSVAGYRSVRDLHVPLSQVNVITGPNGSGKSNLYQYLVLVAKAAQGQFAKAVAEEGGTPSLLWAGGERIRYTRKQPPRRFRLEVERTHFPSASRQAFRRPVRSPSWLPRAGRSSAAIPKLKKRRFGFGPDRGLAQDRSS